MAGYKTEIGSLANFQKGGVEVIQDDPRNYVFSNIYETAANAAPYERIAVAKNFEYVIECARAEGDSPWFAADHDEFALCMDGTVEVQLRKPAEALVPEGTDGAIRLQGEPAGQDMGRVVLGRGHMALLPAKAAYRFRASSPGVVLIQTVQGTVTVQKWADICQT